MSTNRKIRGQRWDMVWLMRLRDANLAQRLNLNEEDYFDKPYCIIWTFDAC